MLTKASSPTKIDKWLALSFVASLIVFGFIKFNQMYLAPLTESLFYDYDPSFGDNLVELSVLIGACILPSLIVIGFYQRWREKRDRESKITFYIATSFTIILAFFSAFLG